MPGQWRGQAGVRPPSGSGSSGPGHGLKDGLGQDCAQQVGDGEVQDDLLQPGFLLVPRATASVTLARTGSTIITLTTMAALPTIAAIMMAVLRNSGEEGAGVKARQDVGGPEAVAEKGSRRGRRRGWSSSG